MATQEVGQTLPAIKPVDDLEAGKAAEHLVIADLILQGYRAYLSDQGLPYDVVLDLDGKLLRIQVKATRTVRQTPQRVSEIPVYFFHTKKAGKKGKRFYTGSEFDIFAFVALDIRTIAYLPFVSVSKNSILLRAPGSVPHYAAARTQNIDQFSIAQALAGPQDSTAIAPYDGPRSGHKLQPDTDPSTRSYGKNGDRVFRWTLAHLDESRAYNREYMRKRRAAKKQATDKTFEEVSEDRYDPARKRFTRRRGRRSTS